MPLFLRHRRPHPFVLFFALALAGCTNRITVSFESDTRNVYTYEGRVEIPVLLSRPSYRGLPIPFSPNPGQSFEVSVPVTVGGTAIYGTHHNLTSQNVTVKAGETGNHIGFDVVSHSIDPDTEPNGYTLTVSLGAPEGAQLGAHPTQVITILPEPPIPYVDFVGSSQNLTEGQSTTLPLLLSNAYFTDSVIGYTVTGTATAGTDHGLTSSGTIRIAAGLTEANLILSTSDDSFYENNETVIVTLTSFSGARAGTTTVFTATIGDNDTMPTIAFSTNQSTHYENEGTANLSLQLSQASGAAITVPYSVSGTASYPSDHGLTSGTFTIPAGNSTIDFPYSLVSDGVFEGMETIVVSLSSPTGATLGSTTTHTVDLYDPVPTANFSTATQTVSEAVGTVTATVNFSASAPMNVSIPFTVTGSASSGVDHTLTSGTLNASTGASSATISFTVTNDTLDENNETVIITLGSPTGVLLGATTVQTITITDDDSPPALNFSTSSQTVSEGAGSASFIVSASSASSFDISVPYTVTGTSTALDHALTSGTLFLLAGNTSTGVSFSISDDALDENDETIIITLGSPTNASLGATSVQTITITDNDPTPTVSFTSATQTISESAGTGSITVQLSAASGRSVSVPYLVGGSATGGSDHNLSNGTITITAGQTTGTQSFSVTNDSLDEPDETILVTLSGPTNATTTAPSTQTITLTDDDPPPGLQFQAANHTINEGVGVATVAFQITAASGYDIEVPFTVSGTATRPADHNLASGAATIWAGNTTGTITLSIIDDALVEGTETVIITLTPTPYATLGSPTVHTVIINDNDRQISPDISLEDFAVPDLAGWYPVPTENRDGDWLTSLPNRLANEIWKLPEPGAEWRRMGQTPVLLFTTFPPWPPRPVTELSGGWVEIGDKEPLSLTLWETESPICAVDPLPPTAERRLLEAFTFRSPQVPLKLWEYLSAKYRWEPADCVPLKESR